MLPLAILRQWKVICVGVMTLFSSGGGLFVAYYLPIWFQVVQGTNPIIGGVHFLPSIGALVFGSVLAGALGTFLPLHITPWVYYDRRGKLTEDSDSDRLLQTIRYYR